MMNKLLKFLDKFEADRYYEAYEMPNGKIILIGDDSRVIFLSSKKEYYNYKEKLKSKFSKE